MASDPELILSAVLEEYKALRAEVTRLVDRQYPIVYWGISSVAVVVGLTVNSWENLTKRPAILLFLFFFIMPAFMTAYVITWSHIIVKIANLGSYIYLVEKKSPNSAKLLQPPITKIEVGLICQLRGSTGSGNQGDISSFSEPVRLSGGA